MTTVTVTNERTGVTVSVSIDIPDATAEVEEAAADYVLAAYKYCDARGVVLDADGRRYLTTPPISNGPQGPTAGNEPTCRRP